MKRNLSDYNEFNNTIQNDELVFLFGTGISSALTGKPYSWWKWIVDGINGLHDADQSKELMAELNSNDATSNMVSVVGKVIKAAKADLSYSSWMHDAFEVNRITDSKLSESLKKLLLTQVVFATTNYDSLLERATELDAISYDNPNVAFSMLDKHMSTHVLHIHGIYDSFKGIDNIVADEEQYTSVMENQGAQFIQNILGTRTLVFVGCGKTTEDANISRFIEFARTQLKMDRTYYFLCKEPVEGLPDHIVQIEYGDDYADLPLFIEDIAQKRLVRKILDNRIIGRTPYEIQTVSDDGLLKYHFSQRKIPFCGRKNEMLRLQEFVEVESDFLWWSITGQAGSGKSRLAMELLHTLPVSWLGFFLHDDCRQSDFSSFTPFSNTIVVIDYIAGRERVVAEALIELQRKFSSTPYKLRVLLIERDNNKSSGSWYSKLIQRLNRAETVILKEYSDEFLNLVDMERKDVESFISLVCAEKGIGASHASELYDAYDRKFERLRFRPLYLQIFVEAWIDNNCEIPRYESYIQLLEHILNREQERWLAAVDGDHNVCNAFIRLMVRANISGRLEVDMIPDLYKSDWETIKAYTRSNSFVGRQRQELQDTLINSFCQNIDNEQAIIAPQFPDIIKEYMFSYYSDPEFLPDMMKEIWRHSASAFHVFIMRCMMDFPEQSFYSDAINAYKVSVADYEVLLGRLRMLEGKLIQKGEDPSVYWDIIENEYQFWDSVEIPLEDKEGNDALAGLKLTGLYRVAQQIGAWSWYDLSEMEEVIDRMLEVRGGRATEILKKTFLQEHITELSTKGFFAEAESDRKKLDALLSTGTEEYDILLKMHGYNVKMMGHLVSGDIQEAKRTLREMEQNCAYDNLNCVQALCHSSFNIDNILGFYGSHESIGYPIASKCEQLYPDDWTIRSRRLGCQVSLLQSQYFKDRISKDVLREKLLKLEEDLASMDFNGTESDEALEMVWGLLMTLKLNVASQDEILKMISDANTILKKYPYFCSVVATGIQAVNALYTSYLKDLVPHEEIERLYKYVEINPDSESVRNAFFELLRKSVDKDHIEDFLNPDIMREAISDARYNPVYDSGIPKIDEWLGMTKCMEQPYVRTKPKIGRNDPCPCGSGKKFKKCCMGKGVYD